MKLQDKFKTPKGWNWGSFEPRVGQPIRYGWVAPKDAKALCVIFPGLSEYCEKYFEVVHDLLSRDYAVAILDWRGQGKSWRHLTDVEKRHNDDFNRDTEDSLKFLDELKIVGKGALAKLPRILLGHSMGGHIALRTMHSASDAFACSVLTSPMFAINFTAVVAGVANVMAAGAHAFGLGEHYVPQAGPWSMDVFTNNLNLLTSDMPHREIVIKQVSEDKSLRMGGLTYGWTKAAFASTKLTQNPQWLSGVKTPTLVCMAEREQIVSNPAMRQGVRHMPAAKLVTIKGALHEILMEKDAYRQQFWSNFDGFVAKHISPR